VSCSEPGFGLYVHWPFCKAKCPYCDFNSHVRHEAVDSSSFASALVREMQWFAERTVGRKLSSIFFGGGTPSLMPPAAVAEVLEGAAELWPLTDDCEITLEANPTSIEAENFRGYRTAGVNRVSVGIQALNTADLAALGRQHTPKEALAAFRLATKVFPRASFDMIYARPGQTVAQWSDELRLALSEQQGHMSLYQLTIEPGTRYFDLAEKGALVTPEEDVAAALYEVTQELTEAAGLPAYEVSNHAAPGHQSQHNLLYWRYGEYAGVGPGAHGRIAEGANRIATIAEKHPETWRGLVQQQGHGFVEQTVVTPVEQAREYLLMGLRITEGIERSRYEALAGKDMYEARLENMIGLGLLEQQCNDRIAATKAGRQVLNAVIAELAD
jgi:oxygen-independent coproporphyrinogen-3 oxidase